MAQNSAPVGMSYKSLHHFNSNTIHAATYIEAKDFDLPDHIVRRAIVDIPRDENPVDGRVVLDDPADDGIVA